MAMTGRQIFDAIRDGGGVGVNIEDSTGRWMYATEVELDRTGVKGLNQYGDLVVRAILPDGEYNAFVPAEIGYEKRVEGPLTFYTPTK